MKNAKHGVTVAVTSQLLPSKNTSMSALRCRANGFARRQFHSSSLWLAEKQASKETNEWQSIPMDGIRAYKDDPEVSFSRNEATAGGHMILRQQRQLLYYMRLIEHEMPKLVGTWT
jgi:hypothetical protein